MNQDNFEENDKRENLVDEVRSRLLEEIREWVKSDYARWAKIHANKQMPIPEIYTTLLAYLDSLK